MSKHHSVILAPTVTEKSEALRLEGKYTFKVMPTATKLEVKAAIEALFGVSVLAVNTVNVGGKSRRVGKYLGKRSDWKKAIVKLAKGQSIAAFGEN